MNSVVRVIRMDMFNTVRSVWDSPATIGVEREKRTGDCLFDYYPSPDWQCRYDLVYTEYYRNQWTDSSRLHNNTTGLDPDSLDQAEGEG